MRGVLSTVVVLTFMLVAPFGAWAKPVVVLEMTTAREVVEVVNGKEVRKLVPSTKVEPGQAMLFTLKYRNEGDEKATNVVINNPIPKDTVYLVGSARGLDSEITFSIDGGKTFRPPTLLTYEMTDLDGKKAKKMAAPDEYTNVQWVVREILPGQQGEVSFQVKVD